MDRKVADHLTLSDKVDVRIGTRLEVPLLEAARASAQAAGAAALADPPDLNVVLRGSLVAVLCAQAALEAFVNAEAETRRQTWGTKGTTSPRSGPDSSSS